VFVWCVGTSEWAADFVISSTEPDQHYPPSTLPIAPRTGQCHPNQPSQAPSRSLQKQTMRSSAPSTTRMAPSVERSASACVLPEAIWPSKLQYLTCLQEKRYRSMQEHIRRAHPDFYIPKLPATEESFQLMINTPPSQRPQQPQQSPAVPKLRGPCMSLPLWPQILG
jgi:hypothetical protein